MLRQGAVLMMIGLVVGGLTPLYAEDNPPAQGFDQAGSDPKAIAIADQVMASMGGRQNWDSTRYITWNFFTFRTHVWDKWTGNLRFKQGNNLVLMNIHTKEGRAWKGGVEITDGGELAKALDGGYKAWINDSYWLVMPYKLKDSGVTLKYEGEADMQSGRPAHVLQLTFKEVGVTPQNKYHVFVDKENLLVEQWSFFPSYSDGEPRFTNPWAGWEPQGKIMLSGDRGQRKITDIAVFDHLPEEVFTSPEPVDLKSLAGAGSE